LGFNILDIEQKRTVLRKAIHSAMSPRQKLFLISSFFDFIFTNYEVISYQSYLLEFLPLYLKYFAQYEVFGVQPKLTEKLLATAEVVLKKNLPELQYQSLVVVFGIVKEKLGELTASLNGSLSNKTEPEKYCFPLLAGSDEEKETHEGIIETLTVKISHLSHAKSDVFILVPSEAEIEARISQIRSQLEQADSSYDKDKLKERLGKLAGGVAVIKVGATTEAEMKYLGVSEVAIAEKKRDLLISLAKSGEATQLAIMKKTAGDIYYENAPRLDENLGAAV